MYILFFLLELINIYVFCNVALKSVTWFTTSIQIPTLNYLNNMVNFPTKYLLLPQLNIETSDAETTDDMTSDDSSEDGVADDDMTSDDSSEDGVADDDMTEEDTSDSSSDDSSSDVSSSDEDNVTKVSSRSDLLASFPESDSSDSEDEVKHLSIKPSVIIMDEKLD